MCEEEWPVYDSDGGGGVVEQEGVTVQWHTYQRITAFCNSYGAECPWAVWQAFCLLDHKLLEGSGSTSSNVEPPVPGPCMVCSQYVFAGPKKKKNPSLYVHLENSFMIHQLLVNPSSELFKSLFSGTCLFKQHFSPHLWLLTFVTLL